MFPPSWWDDLSVGSDGDGLGRLCTTEPVLDTPPKPHLSQVSPSILSFVISSQGKTDFPPQMHSNLLVFTSTTICPASRS